MSTRDQLQTNIDQFKAALKSKPGIKVGFKFRESKTDPSGFKCYITINFTDDQVIDWTNLSRIVNEHFPTAYLSSGSWTSRTYAEYL